MTTSDTGRDLLAAIADYPECDTRRLVYADWLAENSGTVTCYRCGGSRSNRVAVDRYYTRFQDIPCSDCSGTGSIPDDKADRAELIRVQVELPRHPYEGCCDKVGNGLERSDVGGYRVVRCGCTRSNLLHRESALLKAHPEWFPVCPVCELRLRDSGGVNCGDDNCGHCHGNTFNSPGRIGTFTRGLLETLTVPTLGTVLVPCPDCTDGRWRNGRDGICRTCDNEKHCPSGWASSLVRHRSRWPALREVQIADMVPWQNYKQNVCAWREQTVGPPVFEEMWQRNPEARRQDPVGRWLEFPTPELANAALGQAVWRVLLKLAGVEQ